LLSDDFQVTVFARIIVLTIFRFCSTNATFVSRNKSRRCRTLAANKKRSPFSLYLHNNEIEHTTWLKKINQKG
jgi:hypothetical protein